MAREVVLDVLSTNHDPESWDQPSAFDPARFRGRHIGPYEPVPQGGGDREVGHWCPGEDMTIALLTELIPRLAENTFVFSHWPAAVSVRRMPARIPGKISAR